MLRICYCFVTCFLMAALPMCGQAIDAKNFSCEIHKVFPPLSIERVIMQEARTIQDVHRQFKPEWVKEYIAVEVHTLHDGEKKIAKSTDDVLTAVQLENLRSSDVNSDIYIKVDYLPDNSLVNNEPKMYDCTFKINPDQDAQFALGEEAVKSYLQKKVLENVSSDKFSQYALAAVSFTIDQNGAVENVAIRESSKDESVDAILKQAVCDMPSWVPAKFEDDTKVAQDFVLTLGSMQSCIVPTLNIKRYLD